MIPQNQSHLFWGIHSPLGSLIGAGLLITASGRIAFAVICTLALVWVYVFTVMAAKLGNKYLPPRGRNAALLFTAALGTHFFMILLWIFNPVLAMESAFFVFLCPVIFTASEFCSRVLAMDTLEALSQALAESLILGVLILGLSLIREPLGYGSISFPGLDIIRFIREEPLRFLQASSGALICLGYGTALYRRFRNRHTPSEDE
jgi:hypothetical protein